MRSTVPFHLSFFLAEGGQSSGLVELGVEHVVGYVRLFSPFSSPVFISSNSAVSVLSRSDYSLRLFAFAGVTVVLFVLELALFRLVQCSVH